VSGKKSSGAPAGIARGGNAALIKTNIKGWRKTP
jgi:hypothetical protein